MNKRQIITGIYRITSPTGGVYIGQAQDIYCRWDSYKRFECEQQKKLYFSLKKHGFKNHIFEIIIHCKKEELDDLEIYYIHFFRSYDNKFGMNLTYGGNCGARGTKRSKEAREKYSKAKKGIPKPRKIIEDLRIRNTGSKRTQEQRQNISRAKMGKPRKGVNHTSQTKEILRQKNLNKKQSKQSIEKRVKKIRGQKRTQEQRDNISKGHQKRSESVEFNLPEQKQIRSERAKQIWVGKKKTEQERIEEEKRMMIF